MKKLLALLVVLGLTPLTWADFTFTINGEPQPEEILMVIGEEVELGLELTSGENIQSYQLTYSLSNDAMSGFILPDPETPPQYGISFPWDSDAPGKVGNYDDTGVCSWVEIAAANLFEADDGPLTLMQGLILYCFDTTLATMTVEVSGATEINGEIIPEGTILHTLEVIEIPEPMTIALLGFGGAILPRFRRRR